MCVYNMDLCAYKYLFVKPASIEHYVYVNIYLYVYMYINTRHISEYIYTYVFEYYSAPRAPSLQILHTQNITYIYTCIYV